ncbi:MAG: hypothetical protein EXS33_03550 [Pedosphaera sp.]|nr:hypothetical protein [Pedosphaera sp.]
MFTGAEIRDYRFSITFSLREAIFRQNVAAMSKPNSARPKTLRHRPWTTPGGIRIRPMKNRSGTYSFRVEVPESVMGRRTLRQFKTTEEAESYAAVLLRQRMNNGLAAFDLDDTQRNHARKAFDLLAIKNCRAEDLETAVRFYLSHHRPEGGDVTVDQLMNDYLIGKRNGSTTKSQKPLRERSVADVEHRLGVFAKTFGSHLVKNVTKADVREWLDDPTHTAQTRRNYHTVVNGLFRYAICQKFAAINPLAEIPKPGVDYREPGILTVEQAARLLNAALEHPELELGWFITLKLFCGIRTLETQRLIMDNILLPEGFVNVKTAVTKVSHIRNVEFVVNTFEQLTFLAKDGTSRTERHATQLDPVTAWLSRLPAPASSGLEPKGYNKRFAKLRKYAGIDPWPQNAIRHSYASYLYELTGDATLVCARLGQKSDKTLFKHYRALVRRGDGLKFFKLAPPASATNVIPMTAADPKTNALIASA